MLNLLAEDPTFIPDTMVDVLWLPVLLTLVAWLIFYAGWWVENRLSKAPWKWVAIVPIAWGIYVGYGWVTQFREPVYNNLVSLEGGGKKMMAAHYGALVIPLLGLVGIVLFHFFNHKLNLNTDD